MAAQPLARHLWPSLDKDTPARASLTYHTKVVNVHNVVEISLEFEGDSETVSPRYDKFGGLLTKGIENLNSARRESLGQTHHQLAEDLGCSVSALYYWRGGNHIPEPEVIEKLARIFVRGWNANQEWINDFLSAASYGPIEAVARLNQELFGNDGRDIARTSGVDKSKTNIRAEGEIHSWTFYVFEWLKLADRVTERDLLQLTGGLGIWLGGWWLIRPFLAWPFPNTQTALSACVKYGAASLVLPLFICLLHSIGRQDGMKPPNREERWKLWVLRCGGAYVAYHIVMVICLSAAIILYSAGLWPLPGWLGPTALALVLLFTYALAKQFPATRMSDQKELRFYPSMDILVLVTFVAFGPLIAAFFGFIHPWLSQPYLGGLILLVGITLAIIISMLKKKTGKAIMLSLIIFEVILILAAIAFAVIVDLG